MPKKTQRHLGLLLVLLLQACGGGYGGPEPMDSSSLADGVDSVAAPQGAAWAVPAGVDRLWIRVDGPAGPLALARGEERGWTLGPGRPTRRGWEYGLDYLGTDCNDPVLEGGEGSWKVSAGAICAVPERLVFVADYQNGATFDPDKLTPLLGFAPDLLLLGGDFVRDATNQATWDELELELGPLLTRVPLLVAAGNHDSRPLEAAVLEACNWYLGDACQGPRAFERGPLSVLLVPYGTPEAELLVAVESLHGALRVMVLHTPPITEGHHHSSYSGELPPLLAGKLELVLSGHNHGYEHFLISGTHFVTVAPLGANHYGQGPGTAEGLMVQDCCADGVFLELAAGVLTVQARDLLTGALADEFTISY